MESQWKSGRGYSPNFRKGLFSAGYSPMLSEGGELLRAAPGDSEHFFRRRFSMGPHTSEGSGRAISFGHQSDPTVPISAWYGGALQPHLPGLNLWQPAGADPHGERFRMKSKKEAVSSGNPGKAKPCYLGRGTGFVHLRHPPFTPSPSPPPSPQRLSPPLLYRL